ncbi:MAG: class I SAM-dependent methyltransferase, partial [Candidatus Odinarchaeia archaeon]
MHGFFIQIKEELKEQIPSTLINKLPRGYQRIGDIIILTIKNELMKYKTLIAEKTMKLVPYCRTVCLKKGGIKGEFRKPNIEVIAGDSNTEVMHKENECIFKFDVRKIMFSKGNISERKRIASFVKENETIIDMFAGIGYFSINIAKHAKPKKIIAIELNPVSYRYLLENIKINKLNKII